MAENYVNYEEFYNEIVESQKNKKLTPKAFETLELIANLTLNKLPPLVVDRNEVVSFMMQEAQNHLKHFNPDHPVKSKSALSFFSTIFKHFLMKKNIKIFFRVKKNNYISTLISLFNI